MTPARTLDAEPPRSASAQCELLAYALQCLAPDRRDPERFHLDRAEIVGELRRLGRRLARVAG